MTMRGIDWFAGVGGYTAAMRRAGIAVVGACERDLGKRAAYANRYGEPYWLAVECEAGGAPQAHIWTACASVRQLLAWLISVEAIGSAGEANDPEWLLLECVRADLPELLESGWGFERVTVKPAGQRVFVIYGPEPVTVPTLPPHDGQGPESDPVALDIVLRAIVEASCTT